MKTVEDLPLLLPGQVSLFGEPPLRPELSQWHTPMAVARRLAHWIPKGVRVLEPACGSGNLIAALLELGHDPALITGVELDPSWAQHARDRFQGRVRIICGDFLALSTDTFGKVDVVLTNPPFEDGAHSAFVAHALKVAFTTVGIFPVTIEFGGQRDRDLWSKVARVIRRARLPERVKYGGAFSASFETVALKIIRRNAPRLPGELATVLEEVWT